MAASVVGETDDSIEAQMPRLPERARRRGQRAQPRGQLAETYLRRWTRPGETRLLAHAGWFRLRSGLSVDAAYEAVRAAEDPAARAIATAELRRALEPPRLRLLTQFTTIPDGPEIPGRSARALLRSRRDDKLLAALEADLRGLLAAWFDIGFLELRRIDWSSPAALLEKLVDYEAVHAIRSWRDLKNRLDSDRRCYAFFHPRMPGEPLIFVEVALVQGLAGSCRGCWTRRHRCRIRAAPTTAIFYSISNCQKGLAGISFGNFLIKQVVETVGRTAQSAALRHAVADPGIPRAGSTRC